MNFHDVQIRIKEREGCAARATRRDQTKSARGGCVGGRESWGDQGILQNTPPAQTLRRRLKSNQRIRTLLPIKSG